MVANSEKRGKRIHLERFILQTLATCGVVATAVVAPNAIGALKKIDPTWQSKIDPRKRVSQTLYRLRKKGFVTISGHGKKTRVRLTKKGKKTINDIDETKFYVRKPLRWDGRWRMVLFDIAERRRSARNQLRHMLKKIGFIQFQGSVWVYPYDCEEVISLVRTNSHLGREVVYVIADVIEYDTPLRKHFNLRSA